MSTNFQNVYDDDERALAYASLDFPGTYYLAFRDIPQLLAKHVSGTRALDFGCGAGRSTRFLAKLGFDVTGIDISEPMIREASSKDPNGVYLLVRESWEALAGQAFDLILCAFPFDNIPGREHRVDLFRRLADHLKPTGRILNLVSSPEIYLNEWLSFSTREYPENRHADSGDIVRIVMLDVPDRRPVEDILWREQDYLQTFAAAGLEIEAVHHPIGHESDPFVWVSEQSVSPWTIHIARKRVGV